MKTITQELQELITLAKDARMRQEMAHADYVHLVARVARYAWATKLTALCARELGISRRLLAMYTPLFPRWNRQDLGKLLARGTTLQQLRRRRAPDGGVDPHLVRTQSSEAADGLRGAKG
jgi:hypothetical protein